MKYELRKGTLGTIAWLQTTAKNPLAIGGTIELYHIAEACWIFTLDLAEAKKLTQQKVKIEVEKLMDELDSVTFTELQNHAEIEIKKFFNTDTKPKKQRPLPRKAAKRVRHK